MTFKELRERKKQEREEKRRELIERISKDEPPKSLGERLTRASLKAAMRPRMVTSPQGIVTYTLPDKPDLLAVFQNTLDYKTVDQQIREVLAANPDLSLDDLKDLEPALRVKVLSFKKTKPPEPPPDQDIIF
jgi:hypothetical protein